MTMQEFIKELKAAGFQVFQYKGAKTNCHFARDNKLGYVQAERGNFRFTSVHKPNQKSGAGFGCKDGTYEPTIEIAERTCNTFCPDWAQQWADTVKKYDSADDYMARETVLEYEYV